MVGIEPGGWKIKKGGYNYYQKKHSWPVVFIFHLCRLLRVAFRQREN
jgi:hypothetical protein